MPENIFDYTEKEKALPPRINPLNIPTDSTKSSILKWGIYIAITLVFIAYLYLEPSNHRKIDTLFGASLAFFIAFPLFAIYFFNFLFNGLLFLFHWLFVARIKNIWIHKMYSKIYFTTPTSLIFMQLLFIFAIVK